MWKVIAVSAALLISACSTSQIQTADQALIAACGGYAVTLSSLADFRAKGMLTPAIVAKVDQVDVVAGPLCSASSPLPTDTATALALVQSAGNQLVVLLATAKK